MHNYVPGLAKHIAINWLNLVAHVMQLDNNPTAKRISDNRAEGKEDLEGLN
jgi:hypothetical protein